MADGVVAVFVRRQGPGSGRRVSLLTGRAALSILGLELQGIKETTEAAVAPAHPVGFKNR